MNSVMRALVTSVAALLAALVIPLSVNAESDEASVWPGMAVMKGGQRGYVDTPMGQVHYRMMGTGEPVLLLHQTPWFSVQFATSIPHLAEMGMRVLAPDRPGYGMSDVPDAPPTIENYADNLVHVLDRLGIETIAVIGHHTGASVAAAFAHQHPDRVSRLILHGTPLYTKEEQAQRLARPHWDRWLEEDGGHLSNRFAMRAARLPEGPGFQGVQWSVLSFFMAGETEWYGHKAAFAYDMEKALKEISVPTYVMSHKGDALFRQTARVQELRPDFVYMEFDGGYSHVMYDDPGPWAEKIASFVLQGQGG